MGGFKVNKRLLFPPTDKHINDSAETAVAEALHGLCRLNPQLTLDRESNAVYIKDFDKSKVSLIAGGGSGAFELLSLVHPILTSYRT